MKPLKDCQRLLIALLFCAAAAAAQNPSSEKLPPSIRASGEAVITVQPDRAQIDVGVTTQAAASQAAVEQNAQKLTATLARLRALLGASADIKTVSYTVSPNYVYPREGGEPSISGYTATNVVRVTLDDLTLLGKVIDAASETGANRIQNLRFTLRDDRAVQAQALREAAQQARRKTDALAAALNLNVIRVLTVEESGPVSIPLREASFVRAETASTPIEAGTIEVRATVTLTVEVR